MQYTNIIAIKDIIILEKAKEKKLSKDLANITVLAEVAEALSLVNLARRYMLAMNNSNLDVAKELRLTGVKKY